MMRFCSLGSGSSGNATLIESRREGRVTRVLVDCGFTLRALGARLARHGLLPCDIDAVFVTHEHGDHVGCAVQLARRHGVALHTSAGTWRAIHDDRPPPDALHIARDGEAVIVGDLELTPFAVPHDASEPLQLSCTDGTARLGVITDLGEVTSAVIERLRQCHALLLECNHDAQMLWQGPYPAFLKRRVGGPRGHLANDQSAALLEACRHSALRHVVAAHLSLQNNTPMLAALALATVLDCQMDDIVVADAVHGSPWLDVH
jgi:phosphoribosyl 1,2-cyclic phosphodiesterase